MLMSGMELVIGDQYECRNGLRVTYTGISRYKFYPFTFTLVEPDEFAGCHTFTCDHDGHQTYGVETAYDIVKHLKADK